MPTGQFDRKLGEPCLSAGCTVRVGYQNKWGYCDTSLACKAAQARAKRAVGRFFCEQEGCDNRVKVDNQTGYCQSHKTETSRQPMRTCAKEGCETRLMAHNETGYCVPHWSRQRMGDHRMRARRYGSDPEMVYRSEVWDRDCGVCYLCNLPADPTGWHLDHVIPLAAGGLHKMSNVAVTHPTCNLRKGDRILVDKQYP